MIALFKIFLLVAVVKMLITYDKPVFCAVTYAVGSFLLHVMLGLNLGIALAFALVELAVTTVMFTLMNRADGTAWWVIFIVGTLVLGAV